MSDNVNEEQKPFVSIDWSRLKINWRVCLFFGVLLLPILSSMTFTAVTYFAGTSPHLEIAWVTSTVMALISGILYCCDTVFGIDVNNSNASKF